MKILVTGARGLLGSACCRQLSGKHDVISSGAEDLRNKDAVYWLFNRIQPEAVIHCAAKVGGVKANRDNPVEFIEDNVAINSNVIAASHLFGVRKLVNIATSCMYPRNAEIPVREDSLLTGPFEPDVAAYASAKFLAYMTCNAYRNQHGCNFVTVCPANLYGPNDNYGPSAHVIPALIHKAFVAQEKGESMAVWGDGSAVREFLHSDDAASAIELVLDKWDSDKLINIGSGIGTTIQELATTIAHVVGGIKSIEWLKGEPTGIQRKTFDISRLKSIGWEQKISLLDGIICACEEYSQSKRNGTLRFK